MEHTQPSAAALRWLSIALFIALSFVSSEAAFAKGGDLITNFPYIHAVAGKQEAIAMTVDHAGNIIAVGTTRPGSDDDYFVAKFKADGSGMAWTPASFGTTGNDVATAVTVDSKDNIIVTGYTLNGTDTDIHTIKYCASATPATDCPAGKQTPGAVIWEHTLANPLGNDSATAIAVDSSDNIYVAGSYVGGTTNDDFLIIKYPSAGATPTWTEIYDDPANPNKVNKIQAIAVDNSGFAVTGFSGRGATFDILTRKYDLNKVLVRQWRHSDSGTSMGKAVKLDSGGNVIVTGYITNALGNTDIYTVKYNPASDTPVWEKVYGYNSADEPKGLWVDSAGDVYVTGSTNTLAGGDDIFTARYDGANGNLKWKAIYDSGNGAIDIPAGIVVDNAADGGVFVTGYTTVPGYDDIVTIKYKKDSVDNGVLLWKNIWTGSGNKNNRPAGIGLDSSRNVIVAGWADSAATGYNFLAFKYDYGAINAPTNLTATATTNTSIALTWTDNSSNETKFVIQRKTGEGGTWADLTTSPAILGPGTLNYSDANGTPAGNVIDPNKYYYYRVRAWNATNGDSDYSNEAHALTKVVSYDTAPWNYVYNSVDNFDDKATAITFDITDNHPVVTGISELRESGSESLPTDDFITIKFDRTDKSIKWKARYDSGDNATDWAAGVVLDSSGNAVVAGTCYMMNSDEIYTRKVYSGGVTDGSNPPLAWFDKYGTPDQTDVASMIAMVKDASNNSVVIGYGRNSKIPVNDDDAYIIKYDNGGNRAFTPIKYDSGRHDQPTSVAFDSAGDIFVTGHSFDLNDTPASPTGSYDWFTAKYNGTTGAQIWLDTFNSGYGDDKALSLDVDSSGNVFVTGQAKNSAGKSVFYTIKYDGKQTPTTTRRIWEKSFNYSGFDARAVSVKVDQIDGHVVVGGTAYVNAADSDFHLIRYNFADGSVIWDRNFDRPTAPQKYDYLTAMTMDSSGYIYLAGNTRNGLDTDPASDDSSDILSIVYDYEGTFLAASKFNGTANKKDTAAAITVNNKGEAFIAGASLNAANSDYAVMKQINSYFMVPAPFTATANPDGTKVDLGWAQNNNPAAPFRIERTAGPSHPGSTWTLVTSPGSGTLTYQDTGRSYGTNYCYRIEAYDSTLQLNSRKIEKCVTTTLLPPTTVTPTADSSTQISLNWTQINGNTGYKIQRKIGAGSWNDLIEVPADQNYYTDSELTPGTSYTYQVSTKNIGGNSSYTASSAKYTKPAAPAMAANGTITATSVIVNWTNVAGETGYKVDRKDVSTGIWTLAVCTKGADTLTCTDSGVTANKEYYYRVTAYNASGDSTYSDEKYALTLFTSPTLNSAVFNSGTPTQIDLVWSDVGVANYTVQRSTCSYNNSDYDVTYCTAAYLNNTSYWTSWANINTAVAATIYSYNSGQNNGGYAYAYRIIANHAPNNSDPSNAIIAWTSMTAPTVSVAPDTSTSLKVSWDNIRAATNYYVEKKLGTSGTWGPDGGAQGKDVVLYTSSGLAASTQYCYRVRATSTLPNPPADVYSADPGTTNCMFTPLNAPTLNAPGASTPNQIDLSWNAVAAAEGYDVQWRTFNNASYYNNPSTYVGSDSNWGAWSAPISVGNTTNYSKTGLEAGKTYQFQVRDTYSFAPNVSAWSNSQWKTTIPPAPVLNLTNSAVSTSQLNVAWGDVYGESNYKLYWKLRGGSDCTPDSGWSGPFTIGQNGTGYNHTGLSTNTFYCYKVYAYNTSGDSPYSTAAFQTTLLDPPAFNAPTGITNAKIDLSWSQMANNTGYKLERKTGYNGSWGGVTGANPSAQDMNTFSNTSLTTGTTYVYRVRSNNAGGSSLPSNELWVTTTPADVVITPTAVSEDEIDLCWPVTLGATSYKVERKEGSAGAYGPVSEQTVSYGTSYCGAPYPTGSCPSATPTVYCMKDTGLKENTNYYYHVHSANGTDSAANNDVNATTLGFPNQYLAATPLFGGFSIRLDWTPMPCTPIACDNPDNFEIQRQLLEGVWSTIKTVGGATLAYTDSIGIEPNKKYSYRVRSIKGALQSPYSVAVAFTPSYTHGSLTCVASTDGYHSVGPSTPSAATGITATAGDAQVTISWTAGAGATSSLIKYGTSADAYGTVIDPDTSPRIISSLTNGQTIYYQIGAKNAGGITWSAVYSVTPVAPPTGISAISGNAQATISWTAGTGSASSLIQYGNSSGSYETTIDPVTSPQTITGLTNEQTIYYRVGAKNPGGTTWSAENSVTPSASAPSAATGISATAGGAQVTISWTAGTGSTSSVIMYGTTTGVYGTTINSATSPNTINSLINGQTYFYRVGAVNGSGTTWSAENTVTIAGTPTAISAEPGSTQATISWTTGAGSASSLFRYATTQVGLTSATPVDPAVSPYIITGLTTNTTYYYQVGAKNAFGITWSDNTTTVTPARISYQTKASANAASGNLNISAPANIQAGDFLIISVTNKGATNTAPSMSSTGWTTLQTLNINTGATKEFGFSAYKVAAAEDVGTTYTVTNGAGSNIAANVYAFRGVNTVTQIDVNSGKANTTASTTLSANTITTTAAYDMIVFLGQVPSASTTFSAWATGNIAAGNWTAINNTGTTNGSNGAAYATLAAASATGAGTATITSKVNGGVLVALKCRP